MIEPEIELILYVLVAFSIACGLFYGVAFVVQRIRLLWIEIESNRIDMLAKRASVKMALDESDLKTQVIALDANGLAPISRRMLDSGLTTDAALQLALAFIESNRTHAPVPHSMTYAPHIKQDKSASVAEPVALLEAPLLQVADFFQLYQRDELPHDKFLLGFDLTTQEAVMVAWANLYSALIGGQSGSGKSTLIRSLLAQSALQGGRFAVIDPHYESGDESLGASLMPLRSRMLFDVAADDNAMLQALRYVSDVGRNRLTGKDADRTPLVLVVDETTALLQRGKIAEQLISVLEMIAQETRKVSVYALCIGQNFSAEIMPTTARNSFVSMVTCKARRDVARMQSGNAMFAKLADTLTIGQAAIMLPTGEIKTVAVPNTTQRHLESVGAIISAQKGADGKWDATGVKSPSQVLPKPFQTPDLVTDGKGYGKGMEGLGKDLEPVILDAKAQRAIAMFASGKSFGEIVRTVWDTKGGRAYQDAMDELQAIIRSQMGGNQ